MAILSFIGVHDLDRFIAYLRENSVDVDEYGHTVLLDSSEYAILICRIGDRVVAYMAIHYIDSHYAALSRLGSDASDREIIEALVSIERDRVWRVPVEPVIYIASEDFIKILTGYHDNVPEEATTYLNRYRGETLLNNIVSTMVDLVKYLD